MPELKYPLFDGENRWNGAVVTIEDGRVAEVFGIDDPGTIKEGTRAGLLLIDGRSDETITDKTNIKPIRIDGKPIL